MNNSVLTKKLKKYFCIILSALMILSSIQLTGVAVQYGEFNDNCIVLDIDDGKISLVDGNCMQSGDSTPIDRPIYIHSSSKEVIVNQIYISNSNVRIYLDSVNLSFASPISVENGANVEIITVGKNSLVSSNARYPAVRVYSGCTFTLDGYDEDSYLLAKGKTYSCGIGAPYGTNGGIINIKGGCIEAYGYSMAAGIGGSQASHCEEINISGGTITANGFMAGIGGGYGDGCGTVNITSGHISAIGSSGAGIGSGQDASDSKKNVINISGNPFVEATSTNGAGIGGGRSGTTGEITISGGNITAKTTGGPYYMGAGIGAGNEYKGGNIIISGGTIVASGATGIGGGYQISDCGNITITGGNITADGKKGAGIGGGFGSTEGTVSISGKDTVITATAAAPYSEGDYVQGIGNELYGKGRVMVYISDITEGNILSRGIALEEDNIDNWQRSYEPENLAEKFPETSQGNLEFAKMFFERVDLTQDDMAPVMELIESDKYEQALERWYDIYLDNVYGTPEFEYDDQNQTMSNISNLMGEHVIIAHGAYKYDAGTVGNLNWFGADGGADILNNYHSHMNFMWWTKPIIRQLMSDDSVYSDSELITRYGEIWRDFCNNNWLTNMKLTNDADYRNSVLEKCECISYSVELEVSNDTDIASLAPKITVSDGATVSPTSETPVDFSSPVTYTVTGNDGIQRQYLVTVKKSDSPTANVNKADVYDRGREILSFSFDGINGKIASKTQEPDQWGVSMLNRQSLCLSNLSGNWLIQTNTLIHESDKETVKASIPARNMAEMIYFITEWLMGNFQQEATGVPNQLQDYARSMLYAQVMLRYMKLTKYRNYDYHINRVMLDSIQADGSDSEIDYAYNWFYLSKGGDMLALAEAMYGESGNFPQWYYTVKEKYLLRQRFLNNLKTPTDRLFEDQKASEGIAEDVMYDYSSFGMIYHGLYIMREDTEKFNNPDSMYMAFSAIRRGNGHETEGTNKVYVEAYGRPMLINEQGGGYAVSSHTSAWTKNTVHVDGQAQSNLCRSNHAAYETATDNEWYCSENFDYAKARQNTGYGSTIKDVEHQREVIFAKDAGLYVITDTMIPSDENAVHTYTQSWNIGADYKSEEISIDSDKQLIFTTAPSGANFLMYSFSESPMTYERFDTTSTDIHSSWKATGTTKAITVMIPYKSENPVKSVDKKNENGVAKITVTLNDETVLVFETAFDESKINFEDSAWDSTLSVNDTSKLLLNEIGVNGGYEYDRNMVIGTVETPIDFKWTETQNEDKLSITPCYIYKSEKVNDKSYCDLINCDYEFSKDTLSNLNKNGADVKVASIGAENSKKSLLIQTDSANPSYSLNLVKGGVYEISAFVKSQLSSTQQAKFVFTRTDSNGNPIKTSWNVKNIDITSDGWTKLSAVISFDEDISQGGCQGEISIDLGNVKKYYFDNFSVKPQYIPENLLSNSDFTYSENNRNGRKITKQHEEGNDYLRFTPTKANDSLSQYLSLIENNSYTLSFKAKASFSQSVGQSIWIHLNDNLIGKTDELSQQWQSFSLDIEGKDVTKIINELNLTMVDGFSLASFDIDDLFLENTTAQPVHAHRIEESLVLPTCTLSGYTLHYCIDDDYSFKDSFIEPLGHVDSDFDYICDVCGEKLSVTEPTIPEEPNPPQKNCNCICHNTNSFMQFIYKIVRIIWKVFSINPTCACGQKHY